jgi:hypothetical protein
MTNKVPVFRLYPGEFGVLALILIVSGYLLKESYQYDSLAGFFPRLIAIIAIILTVPLLVRRVSIVPDSVREVIEGSGSGTLTDQASSTIDIDQNEEETEVEQIERNGASQKTIVLGLITGGYMLLGFLFGLLWATPPFLVAYLRYTNKSWKLTLGVTAITTAVVYNMMTIFNFTLETGWAFDKLGIQIPLSIGIHSPQGTLLFAEVIAHV